jgi:hypothetical protein
MRIDLIDDPAVIAIAARLDLDEYAVVGRLHRLWAWANSHLLDGHARSVTPQQVDRLISTPNFATALQEAGWLQVRSDGVAFPNFDRWNSQSAKKRILSAKRQQKSRHGNEPKVSRSERDKSVTREEKRREEIKKPPLPPKGGVEEHRHFAEFWKAYPRKVKRPDAVRAFAKIDPGDELLASILAAIESQKRWPQWTKDGGQFIPHPASWLNAQAWNDQPPENLRPVQTTTTTIYDM